MPKVSIILTAYNIENYIAESLSCIINQSIEDIEIIVVDDGSTDKTPEIIRDFASRDKRIKTILFERNTIGGVATAANAGIDIATGDYIGFADGDDLYEPSMFEKMWCAAADAGADLAMCDYWLLDENDGTLKKPADANLWKDYSKQTVLNLDTQSRQDILRFVSVPWRKLYSKRLINDTGIRFPVGDFFYEDNPFHWMTTIQAERLVLLPEILCKHRVSRSGQTMSAADERLLRIFQHHDIIEKWLIETHNINDYRPSLLRWVAGQLSWVSRRVEGDLVRLLFDIMLPIMEKYTQNDVDNFSSLYGFGRTAKMLHEIRDNDFVSFQKTCSPKSIIQPKDDKPTRKTSKVSLLRHGLYHIKHSGIHQTARMTANYVIHRLGYSNKNERNGSKVDNHTNISNSDIMFGIITLQKDLRMLKKELQELSEKKYDSNKDKTQ